MSKLKRQDHSDCLSIYEDIRESGELSYHEVKSRPKDYVPIWCFVMMVRDDSVLSYRVGRYRAHDDKLTSKRTVGFTTLVTEAQQTFFNHHDLGIIEAGVTALAIDVDFFYVSGGKVREGAPTSTPTIQSTALFWFLVVICPVYIVDSQEIYKMDTEIQLC